MTIRARRVIAAFAVIAIPLLAIQANADNHETDATTMKN